MKLDIQEFTDKDRAPGPLTEMPNRRKPKIIAIIPARGGSTRLPDKNMRLFAGRPLVAWSIIQAMNARTVDEVWVTSDSDRILETAAKYGARPFKREGEESDRTPGHVPIMKIAEKVVAPDDILVVLMPTSPMRRVFDIDDAVNKWYASPDRLNKDLISVLRIHEDFRWKVINDDLAVPLPAAEGENCRFDGMVGVSTRTMYEKMIQEEGDVYYIPYFIEPWQGMDINTAEELRFAELVFYDRILSDGLNPYEVYKKGGLKL